MKRVYGEHGGSSFVVRSWNLSMRLHRKGFRRLARLVKGFNYLAFRAILPPEAEVSPDIRLGHSALSVVIHPNTTIGKRVRVWHNVTIASSADIGSLDRVIIESDVEIGAGAVLVNKRGRVLRIGRGATIGANTTVTRDVPAGGVVVGANSRTFQRERIVADD